MTLMNDLFDDVRPILVVHNLDERQSYAEAPIPPCGKQVPAAKINGQNRKLSKGSSIARVSDLDIFLFWPFFHHFWPIRHFMVII
jgi:hypothetical protein